MTKFFISIFSFFFIFSPMVHGSKSRSKSQISSKEQTIKITHEEYKKILKQVRKEKKLEGLLRVVPVAHEKLKKAIESRPPHFDTYSPVVKAALHVILLEKGITPENNKEEIKKEIHSLASKFPRNHFEHHKQLVKHLLEEMKIEQHLKSHPDHSTYTPEALKKLEKKRPKVPGEPISASHE